MTFVVVWLTHGWRQGLLAAFIVFCVLIAGSVTLLASIREPSAFTVWMPFALGLTYVVLPDAFPVLPFDDAAAAGGAIATFALWLCTAAIATPCCR